MLLVVYHMVYGLLVAQTILKTVVIVSIMPYHRRMNMSIRPVQRIKHIIDQNGTLTAGTNLPIPLVAATDTPVLANTTEVITGAKVNGIYIHLEVASNETDAGAVPNVYMYVWKNPGGNLTINASPFLGADDNKRFVIHQEMVMLNNLAGGNPRTLFNGVIVIPKGYRRMGPNDQLDIILRTNAVNITFCMQAHYKEFR